MHHVGRAAVAGLFIPPFPKFRVGAPNAAATENFSLGRVN